MFLNHMVIDFRGKDNCIIYWEKEDGAWWINDPNGNEIVDLTYEESQQMGEAVHEARHG